MVGLVARGRLDHPPVGAPSSTPCCRRLARARCCASPRVFMTHGTTLSEERTDRHCSVVFPMARRDATVARCHRPMIHDDREAGHRQARELKQPGGQASVPSVPVATKPTAAPHRRPSVPSVSQPARPPGPLAAHRPPARPRPRGARWPPRRDSSGSDPDLVPRQRRRVSEAVRGDVIWLSGSPAVSSWADGRTRAVRSSVHASTPWGAGSLLVRCGQGVWGRGHHW